MDDPTTGFGDFDDMDDQPLMQHAVLPTGTPQAQRRRGRKGGELAAKLGRIRTRLARDHAAFRTGSLDPSGSNVLDVIHPRTRAKTAADVTILAELERGGVHAMPSFKAFVHRVMNVNTSQLVDGSHIDTAMDMYTGVFVCLYATQQDVRRSDIRPGAQLNQALARGGRSGRSPSIA